MRATRQTVLVTSGFAAQAGIGGADVSSRPRINPDRVGVPLVAALDDVAHLPQPLFEALRGNRGYRSRFYANLRDAEEDLHAAWSEAINTGAWTPD